VVEVCIVGFSVTVSPSLLAEGLVQLLLRSIKARFRGHHLGLIRRCDELSDGNRDRYLLGDSAGELEHLVAQAETYAEEAGQLLDLVGLTAGEAAIDIGCGVLGILHLLSERVGPNGRVVGVDRERRMIEAAGRVVAGRGLAVELVQDDATSLALPSASFDFVHERTVLLNVAEPETVVAQMVRIGRPGGVVALEEPDSANWLCDPPHPAFDILHEALLGAYRAAGKSFDQGRTVARRLRDAGLRDVQVRVTARVTRPGEYYHMFLLGLTGLVRDQIVTAGQISAGEFDRLSTELRDHLERPGTITNQPNMWQAWGIKP
jgi:ubiquinone/menaquinone biosynthesis C-methylase UbiE